MMLCLAVVLLSCGALCLTTPVTPTTRPTCAVSNIISETLCDVKKLRCEGKSKIAPLNNVTEAGQNVTTYLQEFIEAFNSSKEKSERAIAQKLQKIHDDIQPCLGWMEIHWEPDEEEEECLSNLKDLLKSLKHYGSSEKQ